MIDLFAPNRLGNTVAEKIDASGDCWEWTGAITGSGYGALKWRGKGHPAHRFVYEALVGPVQEGQEVDHLCRNRACVNPDHLEPVSHAENMRRSHAAMAAAVKNRAKAAVVRRAHTHCKRGHPFAGESLYVDPNGDRRCRTCKRAANRRYRARLRVAA